MYVATNKNVVARTSVEIRLLLKSYPSRDDYSRTVFDRAAMKYDRRLKSVQFQVINLLEFVAKRSILYICTIVITIDRPSKYSGDTIPAC